jgi:hypothetical protein
MHDFVRSLLCMQLLIIDLCNDPSVDRSPFSYIRILLITFIDTLETVLMGMHACFYSRLFFSLVHCALTRQSIRP